MSDEAHDNSLLSFVASVSGDEYLKVEENLGDGFVRLKTSEAERRQAKHDIRSVEDIIVELLRNARDASAHRIFVATHIDGSTRHLSILDDGAGVPPHMRALIFEPRVTSKLETMVVDDWGVHGRGMALYSISQNTQQCELVATQVNGGSSLHIAADTTQLKERADQSRWPKVAKSTDGLKVETGPKNLIRNIVEFALASEEVDVYFGSPAEILATLFTLGQREYKSYAQAIAGPEDKETVALWRKPGLCQDATELLECCQELGLAVSSRNCYRIINSEIAPLDSVKARIMHTLAPEKKQTDIYRDARGLKIHASDLAAFQVGLEQAFDDLAQKYFLSLSDEVKVSIKKDCIRASFPFEKEQ